MRPSAIATLTIAVALSFADTGPAEAGPKTWDGRHPIDRIAVTAVYFVPKDRAPLPDWRERIDYYARRVEAFHAREFDGQSSLSVAAHAEPFRSSRTTDELREGDANAIFFRTLREVDAGLRFAADEPETRDAFPILLVLSDVNWRPLDDFWRLKPEGGGFAFEGQLIDGRHHPGAASGGARATYLADRGVGWGLVSADGWRVPYVGSDCVVYHEGVGHAIGLPHPEPANGSVMSLAQYQGWISESWLDEDQKRRLGWTPPASRGPSGRAGDLFSSFRALPEPAIPRPGEQVSLKLEWPAGVVLKPESLRVRLQTDLFGPWVDPPVNVAAPSSGAPDSTPLGRFDRPTPVSYRIDVETEGGEKAELWGYFQVRSEPNAVPLPSSPLAEFAVRRSDGQAAPERGRLVEVTADEIDLLALVDPDRDAVSGQWLKAADGRLTSPKEYGSRIELPYAPPEEYRLTVIAEPLDEPNGLILGQRSGGNRFLVLLHFGGEPPSNALENVDGRNVGNNDTTRTGKLFARGRPSEVIVDVRKEGVSVAVDGRGLIDWSGPASRLSLGDYWNTPNTEALFLGAYDCSYRFHRVGLTPLSGDGRRLRPDVDNGTE